MADSEPVSAAEGADADKLRAEWRRLEKERIDEEVAEAREDVETADQVHGGGSRRFLWLAFAVALVAGIVVTALIEWFFATGAPRDASATVGWW